MKIRLLHILGEGIGGAERLVLDLTRLIDLNKYDITVLILGHGGCVTDLIDRKRIRVLEFRCRNGYDILAIRAVYSFLFSNQFDIIHNHVRAILTNLGLLVMRPRPALVYHEHGGTLLGGSPKDRLFYMTLAHYFDIFIAIHKDMAQHMTRIAGVPAKKIDIIENAVDICAFVPPIKAKQKSVAIKNHMTIGTVARLVPEKDFELFLNTARIVIKKRPDIQFVIVGDGPLRANLINASNDPKLKGRIVVLGATSDVPSILRSFDLFLFTSKIESFGMTLIESLACGVPVVGVLPEAGGAIDLLRTLPGVSLLEQRIPEQLANRVIALLKDPKQLSELGKTGREHVVKHYAMENWIKALDNLYQGLLGFDKP
jgi:glycosyltransferase involved in cell wall biosynthesis